MRLRPYRESVDTKPHEFPVLLRVSFPRAKIAVFVCPRLSPSNQARSAPGDGLEHPLHGQKNPARAFVLAARRIHGHLVAFEQEWHNGEDHSAGGESALPLPQRNKSTASRTSSSGNSEPPRTHASKRTCESAGTATASAKGVDRAGDASCGVAAGSSRWLKSTGSVSQRKSRSSTRSSATRPNRPLPWTARSTTGQLPTTRTPRRIPSPSGWAVTRFSAGWGGVALASSTWPRTRSWDAPWR